MKYLFLLILSLIGYQSIAQPGFSNTYEMGSLGSNFHNVIWDGDNIVVVGAARVDSLNQWGFLFAKFDTLGNLMNYKIHVDSLGDNYSFHQGYSIIATSDGGYLLPGIRSFNKSGFLAKVDHDGDLVFVQNYLDISTKVDFFHKVLELPDGYLIAGAKQIENFRVQGFVLKTNLQGEEIWEKKYGEINNNNSIGSIQKIDNNTFLIGSVRAAYPNTTPYDEMEDWGKSWIFAIDSLGNIKWEWESDLNEETIVIGLHQTDDGGYLYGTGKILISNIFTRGTKRKVIKRDSNFNIEWSLDVSPTFASNNRTQDLQLTPDGNWVTLGNWATPDPSIMYEEKWWGGCHYKFSPQGDSIWSRCDTVADIENIIHSSDALGGVAVLPSGSMISAGIVNSYNSITGGIRSLGWLVKIDQNGCLDTLCNFATAIPELSFSRELEVLVYPNPVTDYLSVQKEINERLDYQIMDVNGRVLTIGKLIDDIHQISLSKIGSGIYFIKITNSKTQDYIVKKIVK